MSLTIVISASQAGIDRLKHSIDSIEFFGGLEKHAVIFAPAPSVAGQVSEYASRIKAICSNTFIEPLPREPEPVGRFGAFNAAFRDTVNLQRMMGNKNPWMWWEEDMTVVGANPWDILESEYNRKGLPFMGVRRRAADVMRNRDGSPLEENDPRAQGDYMVAVGIYPPNFRDISTMFKYPDPAGAMPTDVLIRHEINKYLQHTELIDHHWNTGNYRRNEHGQIECDDFKPNPNFPSYAGTLNPVAVVSHGCKDGTLSQLVIAGGHLTGAILPPSNSDDALVRQLRTKLDEVAAYADTLKRENDTLKQDIRNLMDGAPDRATPTATSITGTAVSTIQPEVNKPAPAIEKIRAILRKQGKSIMLGDLAADLGIDKTALKAIIETPGSQMKIQKPGPPRVSLVA